MSDFINNVPIKVPNKSGFDFDFENGFTGFCGQLVPVISQELLPNDTISLGVVSQVQLPPLVADALGRIEMVYEAFFVPARLCWKGWTTFMTHPTANPQYPQGFPEVNKITSVPSFLASVVNGDFEDIEVVDSYLGAGSLADYLDWKISFTAVGEEYDNNRFVYFRPANILPFTAYHLIWDSWYRDSRIQAPLFYEPSYYGNNRPQLSHLISYLPSLGNIEYDNSVLSPDYDNCFYLIDPQSQNKDLNPALSFLDGSNLFETRQRNWAKDYFTSASTYPQASVVGSTVDFSVVDGEGSFSIAALRAANSVQQWLERNNLAGYRYADQIYAQFGIYPSDAIMDRPLYLGRFKHFVYNRSVFQQTPSANHAESAKNPFSGNVGAKFGSAQGIGDGSIIDSFTASEHGFLFVLASLVPRANYSQGRHRKFDRIEIGDYAFPLLANMGDQMIRCSELLGFDPGDSSEFFGYTDLYAEYKVNNDQIHGLLRDDYNLEHFALQRSFTPEDLFINSDFLQIPQDYLDQILAVGSSNIGASYWCDCFFKFKKVSTLPTYSQPTLMDLQNGHVEHITRGGKRL